MGICYSAHCGSELHPSLAALYVTPVSGRTSHRSWQHAECRWQAGVWLRSRRVHVLPAEFTYRRTLARTASHFKPHRAQSKLAIMALTFNLKRTYSITSQLPPPPLSYSPYFFSNARRCMKSLINFTYTRFPCIHPYTSICHHFRDSPHLFVFMYDTNCSPRLL